MAVSVLAGSPSQAQGFMVKPMRMDVDARAGETVEIPLEIRNTAGDETRIIDLRLVELTQSINGAWKIIEAGSPESGSTEYSSLSWASLSAPRVEFAPLQPGTVNVRVDVPADAKGFYVVGIIAETPIPEDATGVFVRVRFLIPLIIEIRGRPVRQQVSLGDIVMTLVAADGQQPTTFVHFQPRNSGRTYSRIRGKLSVERESSGRWRPITVAEFDEMGILPGVHLDLQEDIQRRLPSGKYRLRGELFVDGRRVTPLEKEVDFAGDPNVSELAYDTALVLQPDLVDLEVVPGATRTTIVRIENPGEDAVSVNIQAQTPRSLRGVAMGEILGTALSAEPWTEIRPTNFTIRAGGWQNVRIVSRVPRDGVSYPHYYADLVLEGTYSDGQSAGETKSKVHLANARLNSQVDGVIEQVALSLGEEPSQYFVELRFANTGNVHFDPPVHAYVLNARGVQIRDVFLSGEQGTLLPLGKRTYSGELDLAGLEPGYYALRLSVGLDDKIVAKQHVLLVEKGYGEGGDTTGDGLRVTLLEPDSVDVPEEGLPLEEKNISAAGDPEQGARSEARPTPSIAEATGKVLGPLPLPGGLQ
jgi:hypothetical protein